MKLKRLKGKCPRYFIIREDKPELQKKYNLFIYYKIIDDKKYEWARIRDGNLIKTIFSDDVFHDYNNTLNWCLNSGEAREAKKYEIPFII